MWVVTTSVSKSLASSRMRLDSSMRAGFFSGLTKPWPKSPHKADTVRPRSLMAFSSSRRFSGVRAAGVVSPEVARTWTPWAPMAWALSKAVFTSVRKESSMTPMEKGYIINSPFKIVSSVLQ